MTAPARSRRQASWREHSSLLRDPHQVAVQWEWATDVDPCLLRYRVRGAFWDALQSAGGRLFVSREYEHLLIALTLVAGRPRLSYLRLPHPSGMAVDHERGVLHVASTRNPNLLFDLSPGGSFLTRQGVPAPRSLATALVPVRCRYLPGSLYLHDLAFVGGRLLANAVAMNAVVEITEPHGFRPVWWPASLDSLAAPFDRNHLQLNSIAAGSALDECYFTASAEAAGRRRPGDPRFPVDGRGVVFSGRTREVLARGLTRPHSARILDGELWLANSGYGQLGRISGARFESVLQLPGWTRGLCGASGTAFVGTSQVIPRFRSYAPGLPARGNECGVHAVDLRSGRLIGSLVWPEGNQIFGLELAPRLDTIGFPFSSRRSGQDAARFLFLATAAESATMGR